MVRPSAYRSHQAQDQADCRERRALSQDLKSHLVVSSTERHAKPDLRCPLHDREGHHPTNANCR